MNQDHLEIINISGEVTFYVLDPTKGVTNIGSDPENDIVLADERVPPFQAMLDHRQKPYRLVLLTSEGRSLLAGSSLPADKSVELQNWDQLEFGRYTLVLVENQMGGGSYQSPPATPVAPDRARAAQPVIPANVAPPTSRPENFSGANQDWYQPPEPPPGGILRSRPGSGQFQTPLPDHEDEDIYIQLSEKEWTINLEQNETAIYELEITNRGNRVAAFNIYIQGLDQSWVQITPPQINLRERQSGQVRLAITPRKEPTSYAGPHYFAVMVSSPNYNNRFSQLGAMIEILPYYQFSVDELSPKVRTISWFRRAGETSVEITNLGNSETLYQLEGGDRENSCNYEFQIPGESVTLANQASLHLLPVGRRDDAIDPDIQLEPHRTEVPITVIPNSRPLFLRRRAHHYEIKVIPTEGQQSPKSQLGELRQRPLFGIIPVLLMVMLLLLFCGSSVWFLFGPRIHTFTIDGELRTQSINSGEEVVLGWEASPFANLRITTSTGADIGRLDDNIGERADKPLQSTVYTLEASNILSPFFFFLSDWMQEERRVRVVPVEPNILELTIEPANIVLGEEAILSWSVENADEVTLSDGSGLPESLPTEQYIGQRLISPAENTTYSMQASNFNGQSNKNAAIVVVTPTGTPVPPPEVQFFNVSPNQIVLGESVTLNWLVNGVESVVINPIPGSLPASSSISQSPQQNTFYVLEARKPGAAPVISNPQEVVVIIPTGTPSPTSTPAAPIIVDFAVSDEILIVGGEDSDDTVTLFWTVQGDVTDIQLSNSDNVTIQTQLDPASQIEVPIDEDAKLFTLTAFNQDKSNRQSVTLNIQTPTPTATPEPSATPTPPLPEITNFVVVADDNNQFIEPESESDDKKVVRVEENRSIKFQWSIENDPETVTFGGISFSPGASGGTGSEPAQNDTKTLFASNDSGSDSASIEIITFPQEPPSPPFDFTACYDPAETEYKFTWRYRGAELGDIESFEVYRTDRSSFVVDATKQDGITFYTAEEDLEPGEQNVNVGNTYYVVAIYFREGEPLKTDSAAETFVPPFVECS